MSDEPAYTRGTLDALHEAVEAEGDEAVFRLIAEGKTMKEVGAAFGISRYSIYNWIHEGGPERKDAWEVAKKQSADALVEEAGEILDEGKDIENSAKAKMAEARSNYRKWLAGCRNQGLYGDKSGVEVNVDFRQLHLEALKANGRMPVSEESPRVANGGSHEVIALQGQEEKKKTQSLGDLPDGR